jgi:tricorn protease-like protein
MDADGSNQRRLTNTVTSESAPAWAPDGTKIAFVSTRDDPPQIYIMDADGDNQRRLTAPNGENWQPAWSPDGGQIAFSSNRDNTWEIYMIGVDGNNERRLTVSDSPDVFPTWSPDGKQIVFNSKRSGNFEIHIMDADGGNVRQLTSFQDVCFEPAWSPDGEHILYISNHDGQYEIYSVDVNGENRQQFTSSGWDDNATPKWLPGCSGLPQTAPAAQIAQEPAPAAAPTPGPLMPPPGGLEIPPDAAGLILNLDLDRDRFHCISANGPATLTITADVTDQDRGLALFWRLVEKNSGWTLDWENVSMQRAGTNQRKYTFNADVTAGTNNFGYPPGMGEAWFQFQIVTGDRAIRTPVYRDAVTFFPCAQ